MNKILVIEDQEDLRELIVYNLGREGRFETVGAGNANDALIFIEDVRFDLILLDLMLPGLQGLDFLRLIKASPEHSDIAVIVVSAKTEEEDVLKGLKMGADDYITKPFSFKLLITKIDTILRRTHPTQKENIFFHGICVNEQRRKLLVDSREISVTKKEFELLLLFMKNPRRVFNRNQLLNSVWGYESDVYTRTVDAHISSLRKKLKTKGQLIKSFPKIGYALDK